MAFRSARTIERTGTQKIGAALSIVRPLEAGFPRVHSHSAAAVRDKLDLAEILAPEIMQASRPRMQLAKMASTLHARFDLVRYFARRLCPRFRAVPPHNERSIRTQDGGSSTKWSKSSQVALLLST